MLIFYFLNIQQLPQSQRNNLASFSNTKEKLPNLHGYKKITYVNCAYSTVYHPSALLLQQAVTRTQTYGRRVAEVRLWPSSVTAVICNGQLQSPRLWLSMRKFRSFLSSFVTSELGHYKFVLQNSQPRILLSISGTFICWKRSNILPNKWHGIFTATFQKIFHTWVLIKLIYFYEQLGGFPIPSVSFISQ